MNSLITISEFVKSLGARYIGSFEHLPVLSGIVNLRGLSANLSNENTKS